MIDRVTGINSAGKHIIAGTFSLCAFNTLEEAKNHVTEEFSRGYYNHAKIFNHDDICIERAKGYDWHKATI
jgi:hypothetical protein